MLIPELLFGIQESTAVCSGKTIGQQWQLLADHFIVHQIDDLLLIYFREVDESNLFHELVLCD